MADKGNARKPAPAKGADKKASAKAMPIWFSVLAALIVVVSLPTVVVLFFGMLPALVSYVTDRTRDKFASFCIGGMNFAGVFPYLMELWLGDHSLGAARDLLTDVFKLGIMYSAAAFGWLMFTFIPPVVGAFLTVLSQRRVATLRNEQRQLIDEWGEGVTRTREQDEVMARQARAPAGPMPSEN